MFLALANGTDRLDLAEAGNGLLLLAPIPVAPPVIEPVVAPILRRPAVGRWLVALRINGIETFIPQLASGFNFKQVVNKPDVVTFAINGDDRIASVIVEQQTDVLVYRNATKMFRGRLLVVDDNVEGDTYTLPISAADYSQLLHSRMIPPAGATYLGVDQAQIVWQLIQLTQAQTSGDLTITAGTLTGGTLRDRTYLPGVPYIGQLIDDLSKVSGGFDWWIDENLALQVRTPRRVRDNNDVLNYPGNVKAISRRSAAAEFRNVVRQTGEDNTIPVIAEALPDTRGRWEMTEGNSGVVLQQTLVEKAAGQLALYQNPRATFIVTLEQGVYGNQFTSQPGDIMKIQIKRGRLNINADARIIEQSFTIANNGNETVQMALLAE